MRLCGEYAIHLGVERAVVGSDIHGLLLLVPDSTVADVAPDHVLSQHNLAGGPAVLVRHDRIERHYKRSVRGRVGDERTGGDVFLWDSRPGEVFVVFVGPEQTAATYCLDGSPIEGWVGWINQADVHTLHETEFDTEHAHTRDA